MITLAQLQLQTQLVLALTGLLAFLAGVVFHRSHFCTMGAISDWVIMGDKTRAKQWLIALAIAILGFGLMAGQAWISPLDTIYASSQLTWLSLLVGGVLFGAGMVLGSGCVSKSLIRLGSGNLKSLVVLMAMGIAALATLKGLLAVWRVNTIDLVTLGTGPGPFLGQWWAAGTGLSLSTSVGVTACLVAGLLLAWVLKHRQDMEAGYAWSGLAVGAIVVGFWWVSGVLGFVPEHPQTLETVFLASASGRMEAVSLTAPVAYWGDALMYYSDGSKRLNMGMVIVLGLLLGSFVSAKWQGSFRWEGFTQTSDLGLHMLGGALMGVGGVMAMGCTMGHGLSRMSTLSLGSAIAVSGIVLGAIGVLHWQLRRAEAMA